MAAQKLGLYTVNFIHDNEKLGLYTVNFIHD